METEEERRVRLEIDATRSKTGEMVATSTAHVRPVVNVGVILSLTPFLKSLQLCLSFKLDVLTT